MKADIPVCPIIMHLRGFHKECHQVMGEVRSIDGKDQGSEPIEDAEIVVEWMEDVNRYNFHLMVGCQWVVIEDMYVNIQGTGQMGQAKQGYHFTLDLIETPQLIFCEEDEINWIDALLKHCKPLLNHLSQMSDADKLDWMVHANTTGMKVTQDVMQAQGLGTAWLLSRGYDPFGWIDHEIAVQGDIALCQCECGKMTPVDTAVINDDGNVNCPECVKEAGEAIGDSPEA